MPFFHTWIHAQKLYWETMKTFSERSRADLIAIDSGYDLIAIDSGYKELKRSEEKYREIVNSVPDIIIMRKRKVEKVWIGATTRRYLELEGKPKESSPKT